MRPKRLDDFIFKFAVGDHKPVSELSDGERKKQASKRSRAFLAALTGDEKVLDDSGERTDPPLVGNVKRVAVPGTTNRFEVS